MKTAHRITPQLHQQIWQNLKDIERRKPTWSRANQPKHQKAIRKLSPQQQFAKILKQGGDEQQMEALIKQGLKVTDKHLYQTIKTDSMGARDAVKMFKVLLDNFQVPAGGTEKNKLVRKLFKNINFMFEETSNDLVDMVESMITHGLTPNSKQWLSVLFKNYPSEFSTVGDWFLAIGLWKYSEQCQSFFTPHNVAFAIEYSARNHHAVGDEPNELLDKFINWQQHNQISWKWSAREQENLRELCAETQLMRWNQAKFNQFMFGLDKLGYQMRLVCPQYEWQVGTKQQQPLINISILMEAMLDRRKLIFDFFKKDQNLVAMLNEDIQKYPQVIVAKGVECEHFSYLKRAGFDFSLKNKDKETVWFEFLNDDVNYLTPEAHQYLIKYCDEILGQKNKQGKNCFTNCSPERVGEIEVYYGPRNSLTLEAYQALVIKEHLKQQLPTTKTTTSKQHQPRL